MSLSPAAPVVFSSSTALTWMRLLRQAAEGSRCSGWYNSPGSFVGCSTDCTRSGGSGPRVQFVDWEMAGVGDPCWDAGTVFSECLSTWLRSTPVTRETPPEDFLPLAGFPLRRMQPAMRSFWRSYAQLASRISSNGRSPDGTGS